MTPYIRQVDVFGGYTAGAGHQLYTARAFPKPYWNRIAFINEPTAHLVGQGIIEKRGAGFVTRDGWNLIAGAESGSPGAGAGGRMARCGGDWYNFAAAPSEPQNFSNGAGKRLETRCATRRAAASTASSTGRAAAEEAVAVEEQRRGWSPLSSDNMLWRLHAQRLLVERGQKDVVPQLWPWSQHGGRRESV